MSEAENDKRLSLAVMESNENLDRLHRDKLTELAPIIAILVLLMIIGLIGNVSIFVFYWRQTRRSSTTFFIVILAVTDFLVCCVVGLEITDIINTYVFENDAACKLYIFCNHTAAIASGFVLVTIAIDRHRKLCYSLKTQLTLKQAKIVSIISFTVALVASTPVFIMYETTQVNITNTYNISFPVQGSDCITNPEYDTFKEIIHYVYLGGFSILTIVLIVLYTLIGRVIYRYHKKHRHLKRDIRQAIAQDQNSTSSAGRTSENVQNVQSPVADQDKCLQSTISPKHDTKDDKDILEGATGDNISKCDNDVVYFSNSSKSATISSSVERASSSSSSNSIYTLTTDVRISDMPANQKTSGKKAVNKKYRKTVAAMKVTIMLFVITIVFIVSFVPYQVVSSLDHGEYKVKVGFELAYRSFLLNSVVNPFIFGLFNADFRRSFLAVLHAIWNKIHMDLICTKKSETDNIPETHTFDAI